MKKTIFILTSAIFAVMVQNTFCADREGSAETFLSQGEGHWVSPQRVKGSALIFIFKGGEIYCGGETHDPLTKSCGRDQVYSDDNVLYLKLTEQGGKVMRMPLEIKNSYTIIINGRELKREK